MFGHQEPDQSNNQNGQSEPAADATLGGVAPPSAPTTTEFTPTEPAAAPPITPSDDSGASAERAEHNDSAGDYIMTEPSHPILSPASAPATDDLVDEPAPAPQTVPSHSAVDDLVNLKQKALQQLSPLIGHLDQTPEEKFRTTMMMIQAADNQDLLQTAYEAAQAITDEKTRAQALLDVVNEINYFTQQQEDA